MTRQTTMTLAATSSVEAINLELDVTGSAQVLVVLADNILPDAAAHTAADTTTARYGARAPKLRAGGIPALVELESYFTIPASAQDAAIANARVYATLRRAKRTARASLGFDAEKTLDQVAAAAETQVPKVRFYPNLGVMLGTVDSAGFAGLRSDPRVQEVQAAPQISLIRPLHTAPAKRQDDFSWGLVRIGAPALWDAGFTGAGVLVGHLDTGVDDSHPALAGAVEAFAEFDLLGRAAKKAPPRDSAAHGTHTAGTIAGRQVGGTHFGVAPDARLASAIVIEGGNVVARILGGMDWAVGLGVRILNLSLGLRGYNPAFLALSRVLRARGVLPIIAIGNEGPGTSRSPGNYAEALSVGAADAQDVVADFSGSQRFVRTTDPIVPDLVAPGVGVLSCVPGGKYALMSGSSMAAPHVSGLAALLLQAAPSATPDQIEQAICDSCTLPAGMAPDRGNRGIPDASRAFTQLTGSPLPRVGTRIGVQKTLSSRPSRRSSSTRKKSAPTKKRLTGKALKKSALKPKSKRKSRTRLHKAG